MASGKPIRKSDDAHEPTLTKVDTFLKSLSERPQPEQDLLEYLEKTKEPLQAHFNLLRDTYKKRYPKSRNPFVDPEVLNYVKTNGGPAALSKRTEAHVNKCRAVDTFVKEWNTFVQYLSHRQPPVDPSSCSADDVLGFLKDKKSFGALVYYLSAAYKVRYPDKAVNPFEEKAVRDYVEAPNKRKTDGRTKQGQPSNEDRTAADTLVKHWEEFREYLRKQDKRLSACRVEDVLDFLVSEDHNRLAALAYNLSAAFKVFYANKDTTGGVKPATTSGMKGGKKKDEGNVSLQ